MFAERRIQKSCHARLTAIFEDAGIWTTPFNVYGRTDFSDSFSGTFPWVFIINADPRPDFRLSNMPVIVIETDLRTYYGEMGSSNFGVCGFSYHLFADSAARRDDMAGAIYKHHTDLPVYDYDQDPAVLLETPTLLANNAGEVWTTSDGERSPWWLKEGLNRQFMYGRVLSSAVQITNL